MKIHFLAPKKRAEDGYGNSTADLKKALIARGVEINDNVHDRTTDHDFGFVYGSPVHAANLKPGTPYAVLTMWETEQPPQEWAKWLHGAAVVLNPTVWGCRVFERAYGLKNVVHCPLGYKQGIFTYKSRLMDSIPFTFLSYNSGFGAVRKGFIETVEAFKMAFETTEPARLIIKSARPDFFESTEAKLQWLQMRQKDGKEYKKIEYIADSCTPQEIADHCYNADAFVFPSRGEGFGHTPLEAMATGLPCIISSGHGMSEYFNQDIHYTFDTHPEPAQYDYGGDYGDWLVADVPSLARAMRQVYALKNSEGTAGKKASARREYVARSQAGAEWAKQWSYEHTATKLIAAMKLHSPTLS